MMLRERVKWTMAIAISSEKMQFDVSVTSALHGRTVATTYSRPTSPSLQITHLVL